VTQSSTLKANSIAKEGKESVEMRKKLSVCVCMEKQCAMCTLSMLTLDAIISILSAVTNTHTHTHTVNH